MTIKPSHTRLLVVGSALALGTSTLSDWWVETVRHMGGQGSLRVYGGATPWEGYFLPLLLLPLGAVALAAAVACVLVVRPRLAGRVPECQLYLALGLVGAGAMALTLWNGPGGAYLYETGSLTTRSGPLALVALPLAASPMVAALLLWPWRRPLNRPLTALATVIVLAVLAVAGAAASVSVGTEEVGRLAAELARRALAGEELPAFVYPTRTHITVNSQAARGSGLDVPAEGFGQDVEVLR